MYDAVTFYASKKRWITRKWKSVVGGQKYTMLQIRIAYNKSKLCQLIVLIPQQPGPYNIGDKYSFLGFEYTSKSVSNKVLFYSEYAPVKADASGDTNFFFQAYQLPSQNLVSMSTVPTVNGAAPLSGPIPLLSYTPPKLCNARDLRTRHTHPFFIYRMSMHGDVLLFV